MTLLTEDDARKKWCPFFRVAVTKAMSEGPEWATNRDDTYHLQTDEQKQSSCLASNCMAWRFVGTNINDGEGGMKWSTTSYGYCGAFGEAKHMPVSAPPDATPHLVGGRKGDDDAGA